MPRKKKPSYAKAVAKISRATGRPYRQIQRTYKGNPDALYRVARAKSIPRSHSRTSYELDIERTKRDLRISSREVAVEYRRTIAANLKTRVQVAYVREGQGYRDWNFADLGAHRVPKGPRAGQWKFVYDEFNERPITKKEATAIRRETRAERIVRYLHGAKWGKYRALHRYFTPSEKARIRARKSKIPTDRELRKAARRMSASWNYELFQYWQKHIGGPSP